MARRATPTEPPNLEHCGPRCVHRSCPFESVRDWYSLEVLQVPDATTPDLGHTVALSNSRSSQRQPPYHEQFASPRLRRSHRSEPEASPSSVLLAISGDVRATHGFEPSVGGHNDTPSIRSYSGTPSNAYSVRELTSSIVNL